jgi:thiol-disulfide isomerase/thioredoxin
MRKKDRRRSALEDGMRTLPRWVLAFLLLLFAAVPTFAEDKPDATVAVKVVKYDGLGDLVRQSAGKVVVVDFWATYCIPCKKEMPHLVEMHKKYGKDGLVAMTVSVDEEANNPDIQAEALKFLRKVNAGFNNVILDEKPAFWQEKLRFDAVPCVYVFDRQGKWRQYKEPNYAEIEKVVVELLNAK